MMPALLEPVLNKLSPSASLLVISALLVGLLAWDARGMLVDKLTTQAEVAHLDTVTVKKDEFSRVVRDLTTSIQRVSDNGDSTNVLLRRLICQRQPNTLLCPSR